MSACVYHGHDGRIIAYCPGGRDEDFEWHLREQHIPFRRLEHPAFDKVKRIPMNSTYRTDHVETPEGALHQRHYLHTDDGRRVIFHKVVVREAAALEAELGLDDRTAAAEEEIAGGASLEHPAPVRDVDKPAAAGIDHQKLADLIVQRLIAQSGGGASTG